MKSRNIKTRLAAFGLALLMGLSPLGNLADVHAAEREISQKAVTEKESKTESVFEMKLRYFENTAIFIQKLKITGATYNVLFHP